MKKIFTLVAALLFATVINSQAITVDSSGDMDVDSLIGDVSDDNLIDSVILDADLATYAGITPSANVQSLLGSADYAAARVLLDLEAGTDFNAYDADLTTYAGITPSANVQSLLGSADYAAARALLDLETFVETKSVMITEMAIDGTTDPGIEVVEDNLTYRDFDPSTDEDIEFVWGAPPDLSGATVKVRVVSIITNATGPAAGEGLSWGIAACSSGDDDAHECSLGTEVNSEDADIDTQVQWDYVVTPYVEVTPTDLAAGELVYFRAVRDTADADDDYVQDVGLVGIEIKYKRSMDTTF